MRITEVAEQSGVAVATVKYYVREGLVPPGTRTAANQTTYDDSHVRRVRLVRALVDVGGLSIARAREVVAAVVNPVRTRHQVLGSVQAAMPSPDVAAVVAQAKALGHADLAEFVEVYAAAAAEVARLEVDWLLRAGPDRSALAERALVGTVLGNALLTASRREAQRLVSAHHPGDAVND